MSSCAEFGQTTLYLGDALTVMSGLPDASVNCVLTSPPYWSLRRYEGDGQEQVWPAAGREAEAEGCAHEWASESYVRRSNDKKAPDCKQTTNVGSNGRDVPIQHAFCRLCGAWRGALGLEPDPALFVAHLVAVFREVRRVLHPTGILLCNLGDSYAADTKWGGSTGGKHAAGLHGQTGVGRDKRETGLKPTDLVGIPFLVAQALRADGWYLRSVLPWVKPSSAMPESVESRPASAHEYFLMLTKGPGGQAAWDGEAVRRPSVDPTRVSTDRVGGVSVEGRGQHSPGGVTGRCSGRSYRTSDVFLASLDDLIDRQRAYLAHLEKCRGKDGGLLLDEDGDPLALLVNPKGFSGSKYLGDWSRKEWRPVNPDEPDGPQKKREVWYIAAPGCEAHAHYHDASKWERLGYGDGREPERRAECGCVEVTVDHFAVMPERLIIDLIRAGCPAEVCAKCGAPKTREVEATRKPRGDHYGMRSAGDHRGQGGRDAFTVERETLGFRPSCSCECGGDWRPVRTPTGHVESSDPTLETGRAGMNRPRGSGKGARVIYRWQQKAYAGQLKESPYRAAMEAEAGSAFAHYIRTDDSGARPVPEDLLKKWLELGWLIEPEPPQEGDFVPGVLLDPFSGSGTAGVVAKRLGRRYIGIDASADYLLMSERRIAEAGREDTKGKQHARSERAGQGTFDF